MSTQSNQPNRRNLLGSASTALGAIGLASLLHSESSIANAQSRLPTEDQLRQFAPQADRVIYLFQSGGPPQHDLFDHKPLLPDVHGKETPASIISGQRLTGMTAGQASSPVAASAFKFKQHGESGAWISDAMPHLAKVADELYFIKSMHTDAINQFGVHCKLRQAANLARSGIWQFGQS